ncbi:hypothetical protein QIU19_13655 [Capnocytophaga canimorsus]|nr:hypothetical protein [Capnocytophaga canimorsus]WGU68292.1 hypothetical protein QIU19_13655 [Capnocytophaga canimorsus]
MKQSLTNKKIKIMYTGNITLKVAELKRGFAIVSGYNILRKFKTEQEALKEIENNGSFYEYWAKSASSNVINSCRSGQTIVRIID